MKTIVFAGGLLIGLAIGTTQAPAAPIVDGKSCVPSQQITNVLGVNIRAWQLAAADSAKLVDFFTGVFGEPPHSPVDRVWVVQTVVDGDYGFVFIGPDGCGVELVYPLDTDELNFTLEHNGIQSPVGSTFYKVPDFQGGLAI